MTIEEYIEAAKRNLQRQRAVQEEMDGLFAEWEALTLAYLSEHPLTDDEKERLREAVRAGEPFCCEKGRRWLMGNISDPLWVDLLNDWAYSRLGGCSTGDADGLWLRNLNEALDDLGVFLYEDGSFSPDAEQIVLKHGHA